MLRNCGNCKHFDSFKNCPGKTCTCILSPLFLNDVDSSDICRQWEYGEYVQSIDSMCCGTCYYRNVQSICLNEESENFDSWVETDEKCFCYKAKEQGK